MTSWEGERITIEKSSEPITKKRMIIDLRKLGVMRGDILIVHSSMSKIGWIPGERIAVIEALQETITESGTLTMPALSTWNTNPENWQCPPVPSEWIDIIKKEITPYDPKKSPTRGIGKIPEAFRTFPDVLRSNHPQYSFAAWGKYAKKIVEEHSLVKGFGINSPLGKLYKLNAKILLIGIKHESNTSLHFAESLAKIDNFPTVTQGAALIENGERIWKTWVDLEYDSDDFAQLGEDYEKAINYQPGFIGLAESRLINMRELIDYAITWLQENRKYS